MVATVMQICPRERVGLDPARIGALYAELGGVEMRAMLDRAMAELVTVRSEIAQQRHLGDRVGLARNLRRMSRIAEHLGMRSVRRIAVDVMACDCADEQVSYQATLSRLMRNVDLAIAGHWDDTG